MSIRIEYVRPENLVPYHTDIWALVCECDEDFVPSLSSRDTVNGGFFSPEDTPESPRDFFLSLLDRHFLFALDGDKVVGFTCFRHKYVMKELEHLGEANYVSTTCITSEYRGNGVGQLLYSYFENDIPEELKLSIITRGTWSTNHAQLYLFSKLGYELLLTQKDDRGEGIHSLYYAKQIPVTVGQ